MTKIIKRIESLAATRTELGPWVLLALALVLMTIFGALERQPEKYTSLPRTAFQIKRDLYDLRIDDKASMQTTSLETGL